MASRGPPKKYNSRANTSLSLEEDVLNEVRKSGISLTKIFMKGWEVIMPNGVSGIEYRKKQLERNKIRIEVDITSQREEIEIIEREILALKDNVVDSEEEKERLNKLKYKILKEYKAAREKGGVTAKPNFSLKDMDIHPLWGDEGCPVSYGEVMRIWDEVEV